MPLKKRRRPPGRALRPYQRRALAFLRALRRAALFMDMRLGKTLVVIRAIKSDSRVRRVLIVAPGSAHYGWKRELAIEGEPPLVDLIGVAPARKKAAKAVQDAAPFFMPRTWCFINCEGHRVLKEELLAIEWDAVICDESTFLKNPKAKVSQLYAENFRGARWRVCMSGTPAPESELEYFQQMKFLGHNILGSNYYEWRDANFVSPIESPHEWFIKKRGLERLTHKLARRCFFLKRSDAGCDERKVYEVRKVVMPAKARKAYTTLEEEFLLEAEGHETKKTVWSMTKFIWARRLAGGFYDTELMWDGKLRALLDLLEGELSREQVVVWADYILEGKAICERLGKSAAYINGSVTPTKRDAIRTAFLSGKTRVLVCQPECFRHGVDLSCADTMVYYSSPLGLETRQQTEDRTIRIGKGTPALVIDMLTEESVDEDILTSLKRKEGRSARTRRLVQGAQRRCA